MCACAFLLAVGYLKEETDAVSCPRVIQASVRCGISPPHQTTTDCGPRALPVIQLPRSGLPKQETRFFAFQVLATHPLFVGRSSVLLQFAFMRMVSHGWILHAKATSLQYGQFPLRKCNVEQWKPGSGNKRWRRRCLPCAARMIRLRELLFSNDPRRTLCGRGVLDHGIYL